MRGGMGVDGARKEGRRRAKQESLERAETTCVHKHTDMPVQASTWGERGLHII